VEMIRQAKKRGVRVTCETAPHYFSADDSWVEGYDTNTKVNPPLRTADDVAEIKKGLEDDTIDIIATDHAPHHLDDKDLEYDVAANGISGFETAFSLAYTNLVKCGILTMEELVKKMSSKPASILGLSGGTIEEGAAADLTIANLNQDYIVDAGSFVSKGKNTPFHGRQLTGRVLYTLVDGNIIVEKGKINR